MALGVIRGPACCGQAITKTVTSRSTANAGVARIREEVPAARPRLVCLTPIAVIFAVTFESGLYLISAVG